MTDTVKDLEYYAANPHEMPEDFLSLGGAAGQGEVASDAPVAVEAKDPAPVAAVEVEKEPEPEGIASKNGKHVLPYSALSTEREKRHAAERAMHELSERIKALEGSTKDTPPPADPAAVTDKSLEDMMIDFPMMAEPVKVLLGQVQMLEGKLNEVTQLEQRRAIAEAEKTTLTVQEAIESIPALFYWQNTVPEMFQVATSFDDQIKADPRNRSLSLQDRFSKVVAAVEAVYGKTDLPAEYRKEEPVTEPVDTLASKAKEKIDQAATKPRPRTLSDLPGGTPPAASREEQLAGMSMEEIGAMMAKMTPEQQMELLSRAA